MCPVISLVAVAVCVTLFPCQESSCCLCLVIYPFVSQPMLRDPRYFRFPVSRHCIASLFPGFSSSGVAALVRYWRVTTARCCSTWTASTLLSPTPRHTAGCALTTQSILWLVTGKVGQCQSYPGGINQTERPRRWGRGGARDIAICGSLTAHFNLKNRC